MAVDLGDLTDSLMRELFGYGNVPADIDDDDAIGRLADAFWEIKLATGLFEGYTVVDDQVVPISGTTDMPRDQQQLIVLFAAIRSLRSSLVATNTTFRAKAGPVEFETQQSAQVMRDVLADLRARITDISGRLRAMNPSGVVVFDAVVESLFAPPVWVR